MQIYIDTFLLENKGTLNSVVTYFGPFFAWAYLSAAINSHRYILGRLKDAYLYLNVLKSVFVFVCV